MSDSPWTRAAADHFLSAFSLADYVQERRAELGLTVEQAAERSGMKLWEWEALEKGWVPTDLAVIQAMAETLEIRWVDLKLNAMSSQCGQEYLIRRFSPDPPEPAQKGQRQ